MNRRFNLMKLPFESFDAYSQWLNNISCLSRFQLVNINKKNLSNIKICVCSVTQSFFFLMANYVELSQHIILSVMYHISLVLEIGICCINQEKVLFGISHFSITFNLCIRFAQFMTLKSSLTYPPSCILSLLLSSLLQDKRHDAISTFS